MSHTSLSQNRGLSTHHILAAATLAAMRTGGEAKKAETTLHSVTAAGGDPNYTDVNVLAAVSSTPKAAFITKMEPTAVGITLTKQGSRRAGTTLTTSNSHQRQVSPVHSCRLMH